MSRPTAGGLRALVVGMMVIGAVAACSPTANALPTALPGAEGSVAASADPSGGPASPLPSGTLTDPAEAWPAFAACLRSHGLQVADPEIDDNGDPSWSADIKKGITRQIETDCGPIIAAITDVGGPNDRPRRTFSYESDVAHADCMREHGLTDWPDPDPNDREGHMPPGFDKGDPTVYAGLVACEHLLVETTASPSPVP